MSEVLQEYLKSLHALTSSPTEAISLIQAISRVSLDAAEEEVSYCLSMLFHEEYGVLKFLRKAQVSKEFEVAKIDILRLIVAYIEKSGSLLVAYLQPIQECCMAVYSVEQAAKLKAEAVTVITELIRRPAFAKRLNVTAIVQKFCAECLGCFRAPATMRGAIYTLVGSLAECYPEAMLDKSDRLLSVYLSVLKQEMTTNKRKPELLVIAGCLNGLQSHLVGFAQSVCEGSPQAKEIYRFTRMALDPKVGFLRYDVPKAALALLSKHTVLFKDLITDDSKILYDTVNHWCNISNKEVAVVAVAALVAVQIQIASRITVMAREGQDRYVAILKDFLIRFHTAINSSTSNYQSVLQAVKGYGLFAEACSLLLPESDLRAIFEDILQRSEQALTRSLSIENGAVDHLSTYLESLANIVNYLSQLSLPLLAPVEKLIMMLFDKYPYLSYSDQLSYHKSVVLFLNALMKYPPLMTQCLRNLVYQFVIRTCSRPVLIEQDTIEASNHATMEPVVSFKSFLPFWAWLLDVRKHMFARDEFSFKSGESLSDSIYDEMMQSLLNLLKMLNLRTKKLEVEKSSLGPQKNSESPLALADDAASGLVPEIPKDFLIFLNLVDFARAVLLKYAMPSFARWIKIFVENVLSLSSRYPLVSGWYKLLQCSAGVAEKIQYFQDLEFHVDRKSEAYAVRHMLFVYAKEVVACLRQYKDELLASCLFFLLSLPVEVISEAPALLISPLQLSFSHGQSFLPLAEAGLECLEKLNAKLDVDELEEVFLKVLPGLDDYLLSDSGRARDVIVESLSLTNTEKKRKRLPVRFLKALIKASQQIVEAPASALRLRILKFLGKLGGRRNVLMLQQGDKYDMTKALAWDKNKFLSFAVPFQDMKPTIYLDPFLPRVIELALSSTNRQIKVVCCELFHSLLLLMLGKSAQQFGNSSEKAHFTAVYGHVFPAIISLACDVEQVAQQLFRPLLFQMIHWFTGQAKHGSPEGDILLDVLFDSLTTSSEGSMRDLCGAAIGEFMQWSMKQTMSKTLPGSYGSPKTILKRMYSLALHPSSNKRLGAAVAFNNMYKVFREKDALVDTYLLEVLVVFVTSLKLAHKDESQTGAASECCVALDHVERIVKAKKDILFGRSKSRRVPVQFMAEEDFNLSHVVSWLLEQCGSSQTRCRQQCMKLVISFLPLQPGVESAKQWVEKTLASNGVEYFVNIFENAGFAKTGILKYFNLKEKLRKRGFSFGAVVHWMESLVAALDCYCWALDAKLFSAETVCLGDVGSKAFCAIQYFVSDVCFVDLDSLAVTFHAEDKAFSTSEKDFFLNKKCASLVCILSFLNETLGGGVWMTLPPATSGLVFSEQLFRMIFTTALSPHSVGFDLCNQQSLMKLNKDVFTFCSGCLGGLRDEVKDVAIKALADLLMSKDYDLAELLPIYLPLVDVNYDALVKLTLISSGYKLLSESKFLKEGFSKQSLDRLHGKLVQGLHELLSTSGEHPARLLPAKKKLMRCMLELALEIQNNHEKIILALFDVTPANTQVRNGNEFRGYAFMLLFEDILMAYLCNNPLFVQELLAIGRCKPDILGPLLVTISGYCAQRRGTSDTSWNYKEVCNGILRDIVDLNTVFKSSSLDLKLNFVQIIKNVLLVCPKESALCNGISDVFLQWLRVDSGTSLHFKCKLLEVLPLFLMHCSEVETVQVKSILCDLISFYFPASSEDLIETSSKHLEYLEGLKQLLHVLVVTGSHAVLEVLMSTFLRETDALYDSLLQPAFIRFLARLGEDKLKTVLDTFMGMFMNDVLFSSRDRCNAINRLAITCLEKVPLSVVQPFFLKHVSTIFSVIDGPFQTSPSHLLHERLMIKSCAFNLIRLMYMLLPKTELMMPNSAIVRAAVSAVQSGKEMTQALSKMSHSAITEDTRGETIHSEYRRAYHCSAFNCLASIISATQNELKFYTGLLFTENVARGQLLLDNIVDLNRRYEFDVDLHAPFARKRKSHLLRAVFATSQDSQQKRNNVLAPYLSLGYLLGSSLSQEVSQFDYNNLVDTYINNDEARGAAVTGSSKSEEVKIQASENELEMLEMDDLNKHECMQTFIGLLEHMSLNKIYAVPENGQVSSTMPSWMLCLHQKFLDPSTHLNVKLFLGKLLVNEDKIFAPYMGSWIDPIIDFIISGAVPGPALNYFIQDLLVTVLSWSSTFNCDGHVVERKAACRLLEYVIKHCHHSKRDILKNNLQLLQTLIKIWKGSLDVPYKLVYDNFSCQDMSKKDNATGLHMLGILIRNGFDPFLPQSAVSEDEYFSSLVNNMGSRYRDVHALAAEVCGLACKFYGNAAEKRSCLENMVHNQLQKLSRALGKEQFIVCIHRIQMNHPAVVEKYVSQLLFCLTSSFGILKLLCVQSLTALSLDASDHHRNIYAQLQGKELELLLASSDSETQAATLRLLLIIIQALSPEETLQALQLVSKLASNKEREVRELVYDVFIRAFVKFSDGCAEPASGILCLCKDILLVGINDLDASLGAKLLNFWLRETHLPNSGVDRMIEVLRTMYSPKTEKDYLSYSTNFILQLTSLTPDYSRPVFEAALDSGSHFRNIDINFSWQRQSVIVTPQFSVLKSVQSTSFVNLPGHSMSMSRGITEKSQENLQFTPTQEFANQSSINWMHPSLQVVPESISEAHSLAARKPLHLASALQDDEVGFVLEDSVRLSKPHRVLIPRRILKTRDDEKQYFMKRGMMQKKLERESLDKRIAAVDRKVVMYRKYRVGEVPDIQIKHSELIVPLQAAAQLDSLLASQLFSALVLAIAQELPNKVQDEAVTKALSEIQSSLSAMVASSSLFYPPFISAIENVCLEHKQLKLPPRDISGVSVMSMQQPVGALLLEKQIFSLNNESEPSRKRAKLATEFKSDEVESWVELAKIYKSMKDYDALRAIFDSQFFHRDVTRRAVHSEMQNDFASALRIYREASGMEWTDQPSDEEQDYWDKARLVCYHNLSMWTNLNEFALQMVSDDSPADMSVVWDNPELVETCLPYYMKANVKLLCQGKLGLVHKEFATFINRSLKSSSAKDILEEQYADDLALISVFRGEYAKAKRYINISMHAFLEDWRQMSKLVGSNRLVKLEGLQKVAELSEFLEIHTPDGAPVEDKVWDLVSSWRSRQPDEKKHPAVAWDDVMMNRCAYMRLMMSKLPPNSTVSKLLEKEEILNTIQVAKVARKQGNFALAEQYLQEASESIFQASDVDSDLAWQWRQVYAQVRCDKATSLFNDESITSLVSASLHLNESSGYCQSSPSLASSRLICVSETLVCLASAIRKSKEAYLSSTAHSLLTRLAFAEIPLEKAECVLKLHQHSFAMLQCAVKQVENLPECVTQNRVCIIEALMKMALFCYDRIQEVEDCDTSQGLSLYADVIVSNLLRAMHLGSREARIRFPCLLQLIQNFESSQDLFKEKVAGVPSWMFLGWTNQLVALLDKPVQACLQPVLSSMARLYPQALMFPLRISSEQFKFKDSPDGRKAKHYMDKLCQVAFSPILEVFAEALSQLTSPELALKDYLDQLSISLQERDREETEKLLLDLYKRLFDVSPSARCQAGLCDADNIEKGVVVRKFSKEMLGEFESVFGKKGQKIFSMTHLDFGKKSIELLSNSKCKKPVIASNLKEYSPWLSKFQTLQATCNSKYELEVPGLGHYDGSKKPLVEYHVKISSFDEQVIVMKSIRKPKQITIRGDDEKDYKFLVKGGEDLRQDQRIEQMFTLMNDVLKEDSNCGKRTLHLKTYNVIPVTSRVGIIEWVKDTIPYQDLIFDGMTDRETKAFQSTNGPAARYRMFLDKYTKNDHNSYSEMYKKADRREVESAFQEIVALVPWDLLRRAFLSLSSSSEGYFALRSHFVQSYSCMCIAHYILGIGDRHLSNMLIDRTSGSVIGIDFGHAFGTATQLLPIPELIPFRLTTQMMNLLLPLKKPSSHYKQLMMVVMQAFRKDASLILCTLEVFVNEPLLDWQAHARKQRTSDEAPRDCSSSLTWYPKQKINVCRQKLTGVNPAFIVSEELRLVQRFSSAMDAYLSVAKGSTQSIRAKFLEATCDPAGSSLSVDDQVDCLVDLATDPNVLGRTYLWWYPWI